jgi:type I restriction enzyme M protein
MLRAMKLQPYYTVPLDKWRLRNHPKVREGTPEEPVRQWVLSELIESYGYPEAWIDETTPSNGRITVEEPVQVGSSTLWADIAIKNEFGEPFIFIETKKPGEDLNHPKGANAQLRSYVAVTLSARIGLATNGDDVDCWRKQFDPREELLAHPDIPDYTPPTQPAPSEDELLMSGDDDQASDDNVAAVRVRDDRLALIPNFARLLRRCHDVLRTEENMHADEALDEMCKLLFVKIYDELNTRQVAGEEFRFSQWRYGSPEELASSIRSLYAQSVERETAKLKARGLYDRSRDVFDDEIRSKDSTVLEIVKLLQRYSLVDTGVDSRGRAFEEFLGATFRHDLGQYFTPEPVVRLMVGLLDPGPDDMILDPACGSARFLAHSLQYVRERKIEPAYSEAAAKKRFVDFAINNLHGVEVSRRLVRVAVTDMIMYDDGHTNIRYISGDGALSDFDHFHDLYPESFNCVITNPPYGGDPIKDPAVLGRFRLGRGKDGRRVASSREKELLFIERCMQFLKPGGRLAILLHVGVMANKSSAWIRTWLREQARLLAVIQLPNHTFTPYGAKGIETSVVLLEKWPSHDAVADDYEVFFGAIEEVGYTPDGRESRHPAYQAFLEDRRNPDVAVENRRKDDIENMVVAFREAAGWT